MGHTDVNGKVLCEGDQVYVVGTTHCGEYGAVKSFAPSFTRVSLFDQGRTQTALKGSTSLLFVRKAGSKDQAFPSKRKYPFCLMSATDNECARKMMGRLWALGLDGCFTWDHLDGKFGQLEQYVKESSTLIVFLDDETLDSDWAERVWQVAIREKLRIQIICDMSAIKSQALAAIKELAKSDPSFEPLCELNNWIEYTVQHRDRAFSKVKEFLGESKKKKGKYDYFMSHKKIHTVHGAVPEQLAICMHDRLRDTNLFNGFIDVDNLKVISKEVLRQEVKDSSSMLIWINDESTSSDWCKEEWKAALKDGTPFQCILDTTSAKAHTLSKAETLFERNEQLREEMMKLQWIEYTEGNLEACLRALEEFVGNAVRGQAGQGAFSDALA
jgi:hypothetical protein